MLGDTEAEDLLIKIRDQFACDENLIWKRWYEKSLLYYRRGQQHQAKQSAQLSIDSTKDKRSRLYAEMNLIMMEAFSDQPADAMLRGEKLLKEYDEIFSKDLKSTAYLNQYMSLSCHFLEKNLSSMEYSIKCKYLYSQLNRQYDHAISIVNAGDGAWGCGKISKSLDLLNRAIELAKQRCLPHVLNIGLICRANTLASEGLTKEALEDYSKGIELSLRIGQKWDYLYGTIYEALAKWEYDKTEPFCALKNAEQSAQKSGYRFLEDLARAFALFPVWKFGVSPVQPPIDSPFPAPKAYALSFLSNRGDVASRDQLKLLLENCEGIKGRPGILLQDNFNWQNTSNRTLRVWFSSNHRKFCREKYYC